MKNTDHLTYEELKELMFKPLTKEEAEQLREVRKADAWLFALNLREMDREENESDPD